MSFGKDTCIISSFDGQTVFTTKRKNNLYEIDLIHLNK